MTRFVRAAPAIRKLARMFPDQAILNYRQSMWNMIRLCRGLVRQHRASLARRQDARENTTPNKLPPKVANGASGCEIRAWALIAG